MRSLFIAALMVGLLLGLSSVASATVIHDPSPMPKKAYNNGLIVLKRDLPRLKRPSGQACLGTMSGALRRLRTTFRAAARWSGFDWRVLAGVAWAETGWGCFRAPAGAPASGWMAFTPQAWQAFRVDARPDGRASPGDSADSVFAAARLLRIFVDTRSRSCHGGRRLRVAIAAYNAGPAGVRGCDWHNSPAETRRYVPRVIATIRRLGGRP